MDFVRARDGANGDRACEGTGVTRAWGNLGPHVSLEHSRKCQGWHLQD